LKLHGKTGFRLPDDCLRGQASPKCREKALKGGFEGIKEMTFGYEDKK